jgi:hypothetical protein
MAHSVWDAHSMLAFNMWVLVISYVFTKTFMSNMRISIWKLPLIIIHKKAPWLASSVFGEMPKEWTTMFDPSPRRRAAPAMHAAAQEPVVETPFAEFARRFEDSHAAKKD